MRDPIRMLWDSNIIHPHAGSTGWGLGSSDVVLTVHIGLRRGFGYTLGHDRGVRVEVARNALLYLKNKTFLSPVTTPNMELKWGLMR